MFHSEQWVAHHSNALIKCKLLCYYHLMNQSIVAQMAALVPWDWKVDSIDLFCSQIVHFCTMEFLVNGDYLKGPGVWFWLWILWVRHVFKHNPYWWLRQSNTIGFPMWAKHLIDLLIYGLSPMWAKHHVNALYFTNKLWKTFLGILIYISIY